VLASDFHEEGLAVAQENGQLLGANNLSYVRSDWYDALEGGRFDLIVSNPPYIAAEDPHLPALAFEPAHALVGGPDGLAALRIVIGQAPGYLEAGGTLIVEHGFDQQDAVKQLFSEAGFISVETRVDPGDRPRVVLGTLEQKAAPKTRKRKSVANV
jgi:release factor glutamine methyltransferase